MSKTAVTFPKVKPTTKNHASAGSTFENLGNELGKLSVGRELLDTTWRMTVPVVIFAGIGIAIDLALGSKPWVTLLGTVVGFYFAIMLVKRQIARTESSDSGDDGNHTGEES